MAGAVLRSRAKLIRASARHGEEHVVGFGNRDEETADVHRLHVLPVGGDDAQRPARPAEVKVSRGGGVDDAEAHRLAGSRVEGALGCAVEQEFVVGHVGQIHRRHPHPLALKVCAERAVLRRADDALRGAFAQRIPIAPAPQRPQHFAGSFVRPVRKHRDHIAVGARFRPARQHDDAAIHAALLLEDGVRVIPVGARLPQAELIRERPARRNRRHVHMRHAVHRVRHKQAVPVDARLLAHRVAHDDARRIALGETQRGRGDAAIHSHRLGVAPGEIHARVAEREFEFDDLRGSDGGGGDEEKGDGAKHGGNGVAKFTLSRFPAPPRQWDWPSARCSPRPP